MSGMNLDLPIDPRNRQPARLTGDIAAEFLRKSMALMHPGVGDDLSAGAFAQHVRMAADSHGDFGHEMLECKLDGLYPGDTFTN